MLWARAKDDGSQLGFIFQSLFLVAFLGGIRLPNPADAARDATVASCRRDLQPAGKPASVWTPSRTQQIALHADADDAGIVLESLSGQWSHKHRSLDFRHQHPNSPVQTRSPTGRPLLVEIAAWPESQRWVASSCVFWEHNNEKQHGDPRAIRISAIHSSPQAPSLVTFPNGPSSGLLAHFGSNVRCHRPQMTWGRLEHASSPWHLGTEGRPKTRDITLPA